MLSSAEFWLTIICYIVFILGIASYMNYRNSKKHGAGQLFTSKLSWPQAVMTYIASLMSVWLFFAGPGGYFKGGFVYWCAEMTWIPMYMIIAHFVSNRVWALSRKRNYVTCADFYCDRFQGKGNKLLRALIALIYLISAFPYVTSVIAAIAQGGVRVSGGNLNYGAVILVLGFAMVAFTAIGGFKSVALTDTIQGIVYMVVMWGIALIALWFGFKGSLKDCIQSILTTSGDAYFSYPGPRGWVPYDYRFGYPFAMFVGYSIMLPHIFVRACYAGKDLHTQRMLGKITPIVRFFVWTGCFIVGIVCFGLLPDLDTSQAEYVIPFLIEWQIFPSSPVLGHVLMIAFFCGACGVGLSTADSYLLSAASIVTDDFLVNLFGLKLTSKARVTLGRLVVFIVGMGGVVMAIKPPELISTMIMFSIGMTMPLFSVLVIGMYWKKATTTAAWVSTIVGMIGIWVTYIPMGKGNTYYGAIGMAFSAVSMIVVSLLTYKPEKENPAFFEDMEDSLKEVYVVDPAAK